ncbi:MAG: DUF1761 domain-containing protein [Pseudomonadota bacterium]
MEYIWIIVAGLGGWIFGAIWYGVFAKQWQAAVGLTQDDLKFGDNVGVYVGSLIANILIAVMFWHIFVSTGVSGLLYALMAGFGIGLVIVGGFLWLNYSFAKRPLSLKLIDIGHAAGSSTVIAILLDLLI